jgi:hypothetical protein
VGLIGKDRLWRSLPDGKKFRDRSQVEVFVKQLHTSQSEIQGNTPEKQVVQCQVLCGGHGRRSADGGQHGYIRPI